MTRTLRSRPHLHFAPTADGVYFSGPRTQFVVRGPEVLFRVADSCLPMLEAGATEDDLVAAVGSEQARPLVRHLVNVLASHELLLDLDALTVTGPPDGARRDHPETVAYLESLSADPYADLERLRTATVAVVGPANVTGPAVRCLTRSGVGRVMAATDLDGNRYDAVITCGAIPADAPAVPVTHTDSLILVGPAGTDGELSRAFAERAAAWYRQDFSYVVDDPGPVGDALAGSLAAHLVFEQLVGLGEPGRAYVVKGPDLTAEQVTLTGCGATPETWHVLDDVAVSAEPDLDEAVSKGVAAVTTRWTGPFAVQSGEELPQVPLALRVVTEVHAATSNVEWGLDQRVAAVAVILAALRRRSSAAGINAERWLLDGGLRLLAVRAEPLHGVPEAHLTPQAVRLLHVLRDLRPERFTISVRHVPGIQWRLGRVESTGHGVLAEGWGPDVDSAITEALGTALARVQVPQADIAVLHAGPLVTADGPTVAALRKQLVAWANAGGLVIRGRVMDSDPVLGLLPFAAGPVVAQSRAQEDPDA